MNYDRPYGLPPQGCVRHGVKYYRNYRDIHRDLTLALLSIRDCYAAIGMTPEDWEAQGERGRLEVVRTLADDVFYGLGASRKMEIGSGFVEYDAGHHLIKVQADAKLVHLIQLT